MSTPSSTLNQQEADNGFNPMADLPATENTNSGGFFLDVKEERSVKPIVKSGFYNIEITGVEDTPSKKGKKMLTITLQAENESASAEVRAYAGSWSPGLYFGACHLAGNYAGTGIESMADLVGLTGYAFVKVEMKADGTSNVNVLNIMTRAEMMKEGHALPGFLATDSKSSEPSVFVGDDDDESFD